jgi:hypothetical protein
MASYLLDSEVDFTRMEGDDSDVEITISNDLNITGSSCKFEIQNRDKEVLITKESANPGEIIITGQTIKVILVPADTDGKSGTHRYEFKLLTADGKTYRICRGDFFILQKIVD